MTRLLVLASHAVAEYDDLRMFTDLGFDCFAPGGYEVPGAAGEGIRPPLPAAPSHPDLVARLQEVRAAHGDPGNLIDAGKARLHDDIIDWADAIIVHHFPVQWIGGQWDRIKHKRVIWRTCGQSDRNLERFMGDFVGLEKVRYSPKEKIAFGDDFAGQDALIRFGKYPSDYGPWIGDNLVVGNVTQHMKQRGDACGYGFWQAATAGLPVSPAGPGSEEIGGLGTLAYSEMVEYLRHLRCYLYTGTTPASYTLGLIEAMLSGVPVVSIGPKAWQGPEGLFEGHEIVAPTGDHWDGKWSVGWRDLPDGDVSQETARKLLAHLLAWPDRAEAIGAASRARAIDLFDVAKIGPQWVEFLR